MSATALELKNVQRTYYQAQVELRVLRGINLAIKPGEVVALVGPSGVGKTTLLHIAGLLEKPTQGEVIIDSLNCNTLSDVKRTELRRLSIGFVYQFHHLLPEFSALENVIIPQLIAGKSKKSARVLAVELLERLGLSARKDHRPKQLSGGEQQRIAIARALANQPKILLADEPTGNLDVHTSEVVFTEMMTLAKQFELAALVATHNLSLARKMDRAVQITEGILQPALF